MLFQLDQAGLVCGQEVWLQSQEVGRGVGSLEVSKQEGLQQGCFEGKH